MGNSPMKIRSASLLAAVALAGVAVAGYAQGVFDPGPPPPLPEAAEEDEVYADDGSDAEEQQSEPGEIVYESYEVVQPIPDEPGPAARTIEPPEEIVEQQVDAPAPVRRGKLVKIERFAQASAPDKRVRIAE
jgi:hypothetical protein